MTVESFFDAAQKSEAASWLSADGKRTFVVTRDGEKNEAWVKMHGARVGQDWVPANASKAPTLVAPSVLKLEAEVKPCLLGPEVFGGKLPPHLGGDEGIESH